MGRTRERRILPKYRSAGGSRAVHLPQMRILHHLSTAKPLRGQYPRTPAGVGGVKPNPQMRFWFQAVANCQISKCWRESGGDAFSASAEFASSRCESKCRRESGGGGRFSASADFRPSRREYRVGGCSVFRICGFPNGVLVSRRERRRAVNFPHLRISYHQSSQRSTSPQIDRNLSVCEFVINAAPARAS